MANVADTNVHIEAKHCASATQAWLKAIDRKAYYNICDDDEGTDRQDWGKDSKEFNGCGNGRWTYQTNIEQALSTNESDRLDWCGNEDTEVAYQVLIEKIRQDHEAELIVSYEEAETGMAFVGRGMVHIFNDGGEVITEKNYESEELTTKSLIDYGFASDKWEALEYMGVDYEEIEKQRKENK